MRDDLAARIEDRRYRQRYRRPAAVLGDPDGVEVLDALARGDPIDDGAVFIVQLGWDDRRDVLYRRGSLPPCSRKCVPRRYSTTG